MNVRLKLAILSRGRTQRAVSLDTRIPETRLSAIVRERAVATYDERDRLAEVLDCPVAQLFGEPWHGEQPSRSRVDKRSPALPTRGREETKMVEALDITPARGTCTRRTVTAAIRKLRDRTLDQESVGDHLRDFGVIDPKAAIRVRDFLMAQLTAACGVSDEGSRR